MITERRRHGPSADESIEEYLDYDYSSGGWLPGASSTNRWASTLQQAESEMLSAYLYLQHYQQFAGGLIKDFTKGIANKFG